MSSVESQKDEVDELPHSPGLVKPSPSRFKSEHGFNTVGVTWNRPGPGAGRFELKQRPLERDDRPNSNQGLPRKEW
jgi:hypothetical protein